MDDVSLLFVGPRSDIPYDVAVHGSDKPDITGSPRVGHAPPQNDVVVVGFSGESIKMKSHNHAVVSFDTPEIVHGGNRTNSMHVRACLPSFYLCVCVCVCVFAATTVGSFFDKAVGAFQINGDKSLCGEVLRGTIRFRPIVLSFTVTMKEREKI